MITTNDKHAERVAKLLALADKAGTAEEAANAMAQAQTIITRHQIDAARIAAAEAHMSGASADEPLVAESIWVWPSKVAHSWIQWIEVALAKANRCAVRFGHVMAADLSIEQAHDFAEGGGRGPWARVTICHGSASDVRGVAMMLRAIVWQVERLCDEWVAREGQGGRSKRDSYRKGAAQTICSRLREAAEAERRAIEAEAEAAPTMLALPAAGSGDAAAPLAVTAIAVRGALELLEKRSKEAVRAMNVALGRKPDRNPYGGRTSGASDRDAAAAGRRDGHRVAVDPRRSLGGGK